MHSVKQTSSHTGGLTQTLGAIVPKPSTAWRGADFVLLTQSSPPSTDCTTVSKAIGPTTPAFTLPTKLISTQKS
ncbi:hypothetical protein BaRGS_00017274 [Batillaria attramentaria]|uniref:Uncharacterized protein n=1 Tax=Batillaria attramentaria TaxID=370345 RepID=A0ABD0KWL2_9CAEN